MRASTMDQCVRLGMAVAIIALVSIALYQFSSRASAVQPHNVDVIGFRN